MLAIVPLRISCAHSTAMEKQHWQLHLEGKELVSFPSVGSPEPYETDLELFILAWQKATCKPQVNSKIWVDDQPVYCALESVRLTQRTHIQ